MKSMLEINILYRISKRKTNYLNMPFTAFKTNFKEVLP